MFTKPIQDILSARLQSQPVIVCERNLSRDIDDVVALHLPKMRIAIIDDQNTAHALGDNVFRALKTRYDPMHITLPRGVIEHKTKNADALIAVGSGTINDLCKYASHKAGKPYLVFPTAASMNGYVSATSSLIIHGHKQSVAAHLPHAVIIDMSVINAAPLRLSQAGLGDSLARPTAQADWLLSHHLLATAYDETPYQLLAPYEESLFAQARGIAKHDPAINELLMQILLLSGFGMTIANSSAPASQGEHMIAHAMGMASESQKLPPLHGEEIALTAYTMSRIQNTLLNMKPSLAPTLFDEQALTKIFGETSALYFSVLYHKKTEALREVILTSALWEKLSETILPIHLPPEKIASIASDAELPNHPTTLDWNEQDYQEIIVHARFTRDRFTFLDLV